MANQPWYRQKKFIPIYAGVALMILAIVNGYFGWIDFEALLRPYFTW